MDILNFDEMTNNIYEYKNYELYIDSRDRNRTINPSSNKFTINLTDIQANYRNIHSIELKNILLPLDFGGITSIPYLILQIPEIHNDLVTGTNDDLVKAFTYIPVTKSLLNNENFSNSKTIFDPPKGSISKLTFIFKNPDGSDADFGTDTSPSSDPDDNKQIFIHLLIKTKMKNKNYIN